MPENQDLDAYHQAISDWATPSELRRILRWATPDEMRAIQKAFGSPAEAEAAILAMKAVIKRADQWAWARGTMLEAAKWITGVGGGIAFLGLSAKFLGLWHG